MTLYVHFAAFLGAISLQLELTSAVTFVDLFIAESATGLMPTIEASVITVIPSLSETHYSISCRLDPQREKDPPCNLIDGATVTMNPSGMALERSWESSLLGLTAPEGRTTWDMTAAE